MKVFLVSFILGFLVGTFFVKYTPTIKVTKSPEKAKKELTFISPLGKTQTVKPKATLIPTPIPILTPSPTPTLTPEPTPSPIPTEIPVISLPINLDNIFTKYANAYSIDKQLLARIAKCESSLDPLAQTKNYAGLFQFSQSLWQQTRSLMGENADQNLRLSAEEATKTAAFLISQNHLGVWPNCSK